MCNIVKNTQQEVECEVLTGEVEETIVTIEQLKGNIRIVDKMKYSDFINSFENMLKPHTDNIMQSLIEGMMFLDETGAVIYFYI